MLTLAAVPMPPSGPCMNDAGTTARVLSQLRHSLIADVGPTLYDDLDAVLAEHADLVPAEVPGLIQRLGGALAELLKLLPYSATPLPDALLNRGTTLLGEPIPDEPKAALGLLRRIAVVTLDLADQLSADPSGLEGEL